MPGTVLVGLARTSQPSPTFAQPPSVQPPHLCTQQTTSSGERGGAGFRFAARARETKHKACSLEVCDPQIADRAERLRYLQRNLLLPRLVLLQSAAFAMSKRRAQEALGNGQRYSGHARRTASARTCS